MYKKKKIYIYIYIYLRIAKKTLKNCKRVTALQILNPTIKPL